MSADGRPRPRRRTSYGAASEAVTIRVGSSRHQDYFRELRVTGASDEARFRPLVEDQVRRAPGQPLIISVNGFQPWLRQILHSCIDDYWSDVSEIDRQVQYTDFVQLPERASKRGRNVPWTFIVDQINVPQVYHWSVDEEPPLWDDSPRPDIGHFIFRTGVWTCDRGACRFDERIAVTILFTQQNELCDKIVTMLLFPAFYKNPEVTMESRQEEQSVCYIFMTLFQFITDWQNILAELHARLGEAEDNSHGRSLPVKIRTRKLHQEVDRVYTMNEYLRFHSRAFKKLSKLKDSVPDAEKTDPLWGDIDDWVEELDQNLTSLDATKERFNNLIELEFNITNADQAENSQFLSTVAALFLPVSFLASVFGITTITWPAIWYLYAALPVFVVSALFTVLYPPSRRSVVKRMYPLLEHHLVLTQDSFTMIGDELPGSANVASGKTSRSKRKSSRRMSRSDEQRDVRYEKQR